MSEDERQESGRPNPLKKMMIGIMSSMPGMITCREADAFLLDYVEGTLPRKNARTFKRHLRFCPACRRYLEAYRKAIAMGRKAFKDMEAPAREAMPEDLVAAILDARDGQLGPAE